MCIRDSPAAARTLALRVPVTATSPYATACAAASTVARLYGLRVTVRRAPCGAWWLKCSGTQHDQAAAAHYWAGVLRAHGRTLVRA